MSRILCVINPAGHGGAGIGVWERVRSKWSDRIDPEDVRFTERQGHAREIAAAAHAYDIVAAVGGDGTVGEILSGIMTHREPRPSLTIIPAGTGNDIARNLGLSSFEEATEPLHGGHARQIEVESDPPSILEIDGDLFGRIPAAFKVCPGAMQVLCPGPRSK